MTKRIVLDSGEIIEDAPDDSCRHGEPDEYRCSKCREESRREDWGDHLRDVS